MSMIYTASSFGGSTTTPNRSSVYLGSKTDAKDRSKLERLGITHILNVTPEKEAGIKAGVPNYFEKKKFTYRRIPVYDSGTTDLLEYAPSVISFISNGLHYGSVLVHCQRGVSRSTTCVLFYLMNRVGMDFESAMELVKSRRECAEPIPAFITQLKSYEQQCIKSGLITKSREATSCNKELSSEIVNKSKKRKSVSIESQDKKVQGPKRPIGPSFPSSKSATSGMIEDNHDEKNKSAIIENDDSNPSKKKVKKNPDGKKRSIGPSLPPK